MRVITLPTLDPGQISPTAAQDDNEMLRQFLHQMPPIVQAFRVQQKNCPAQNMPCSDAHKTLNTTERHPTPLSRQTGQHPGLLCTSRIVPTNPTP